jgi:aryl-alcohol dehydrogenase-like predicted oxidoreductase
MRRLGSLEVPAVGYGAMVLSPGMYGPIDDDTALAALRHVISRGAGFIDTSDGYGRDAHNERLVGRALAETRDRVVVATKFGFRIPSGATPHVVPIRSRRAVAVNAEPRYVRQYALASLDRLGIDRIDLWYPHFPDPQVPIEETVGAMAGVVAEGLVAHIGLSNVTADQLRRAVVVHPVAAVQVEWSLWTAIDAELLAVAGEHRVGVVAWSPLGSGFLTGAVNGLADGDFRANFERFAPEHLAANVDRYAPVRALAAGLGVSPGQLALAWLLHQHRSVVPIPGSRRADHIDENLAAAALELTDSDLAAIDDARRRFAPAGRPLLAGHG